MKIKQFTEHPEVVSILEELRRDQIDQKFFSDVVDETHQYVELVQEGGGVLGVALIGYTYVLEQMGLRFLSVAGTSAGSINTLLVAALGTPEDERSQKIIDLLANKNLFDFVDGGSKVKRFVNALLNGTGTLGLILKGWPLRKKLTGNLGLNPGDNFLHWLQNVMDQEGISSTAELIRRHSHLPGGIKIREGIHRTIEGLGIRMVIVAADITTETKVDFPAMAPLYFDNPDMVNPAVFVRASMSIPFFFEPLVIENPPHGEGMQQKWIELASYKGEIPEKIKFVDGGIMSNFPINVFHRSGIPRLPTFGVRLGVNRNEPNTVNKLTQLTGAVFNSARHLFDYEFILKNPDYKHLIQHIDIGTHDWLNFNLKDKDKIDLFVRGARAAAVFLRKFDWEAYKKVREKLYTGG